MSNIKYNYNIMIGKNVGKSMSLYLDAINFSYEYNVVIVALSMKNVRNGLSDMIDKLNDNSSFDFTQSITHITNIRSQKQIRLVEYKSECYDQFRGWSLDCVLIDDFDLLFKDESEQKDFMNCILPCITNGERKIMKIASNKPIIL